MDQVAAHWFAEGERATAVGLVTLANLLGIAVGCSRVRPLCGDVDRAAQYVYAAAAVVSAILFVALAREYPPTPSGPAARGRKR